LQALAEGLEEPSVRIDFLLVLLLQAEEDLDGRDALLDADDAFLDLEGQLGGVLARQQGLYRHTQTS
jgi:hypothetical protein